jgi:hypothetical protein
MSGNEFANEVAQSKGEDKAGGDREIALVLTTPTGRGQSEGQRRREESLASCEQGWRTYSAGWN